MKILSIVAGSVLTATLALTPYGRGDVATASGRQGTGQICAPVGLAATNESRPSDGEWWRLLAHLKTSADERYDVTLTVARFPNRAHSKGANDSRWAAPHVMSATAAVIDEPGGRMLSSTRLERDALGLAGAAGDRLAVQIGDWTLRGTKAGHDGQGADTSHVHLAFDRVAIDLDESPLKSAVRYAAGGYCGYALTRLRANGTVQIDGVARPVSGDAWLDHEIKSEGSMANVARSDRFAIQFEDGRELLLRELRTHDGRATADSAGFLVAKDGSVRRLRSSDFDVWNPGRTRMTSARTGHRFPSAWEVEVPSTDFDLVVEPPIQDQEIAASATSQAIYNGTIEVESFPPPDRYHGRGFVELSGYDEPLRL